MLLFISFILISRTLSIQSFLLYCLIHLLFSFTLMLLHSFHLICFFYLSYLQDLIYSIFSTSLSFTLTLLPSFILKCLISLILMVLKYINVSPGPYLFNLPYFIGLFYIDSILLSPCKMSYLYYRDSSDIYFYILYILLYSFLYTSLYI